MCPLPFVENKKEEFNVPAATQRGRLKEGGGENYLHFSSVSRSDIGETPRDGSPEERGWKFNYECLYTRCTHIKKRERPVGFAPAIIMVK